MSFPLPWEQLRWGTRRLAVSDFRVVRLSRGTPSAEIALHDVAAIRVEPSFVEHLTGVGTVIIDSARSSDPGIRVTGVFRARHIALRLTLLIADIRGIPPDESIADLPIPSRWKVPSSTRLQGTLVGPALVLLTLLVIVIGLSGHHVPVAYNADDPVRPHGVSRSRAEIVAFMESEVMPWARQALEPIVGEGRVTCETCHGRDAEARHWKMPAVRALPEPAVRRMATTAGPDSYVRNALHGYSAEEDNLAVAAHMRGVVMPGMAQLLRRPPYDFAKSYEYNRSRAAFGCYHCHMVGESDSPADAKE
jgi:hypothetical protein